MPKGYTPPSVVPGSRTLATPRLSNERVYQRLLEAAHSRANKDFGAFYSSVLGGIVTEPGLMVLHADDHMVTRGHGVYDVVPLVDGYLYQLDRHVGRALAAADAAGVPPSLAPADIKRILLDTAAASIKLNGHVQFWLTPGRGGLGMSSDECTAPGLYALVSSEFTAVEELGRAEGRRATVSPVEPPAAYFGRLKSSSYLQNVVAQLEAESRGFDVGLFVDEEGYVLGGPNAALAIITPDHEFVYAPSDRAPPGITVQTLAELIPEEYDEEDLPIKAVSQRPISLDDLTGSLEALLVNSTLGVMPVTHVDDEAVADGRPGYLSMALQATLINDRKPREGSDRHTPVPYGGLTGMRSQLT
ncbi:MAG: aminotransferase [Monoraphidium minutum]|nr:MAG: aminotransferase [Monoraphidium minutum]